MITIAVLRSWQPHRLGSIADDVLAHRRALVRLQDELDGGTPPGDWTGDDATAARSTHDSLVESLVDEVSGLSVVVDALETAQTEISAAQDDLEGAISFARNQGLDVDVATGRVSSPPQDEGFLGEVVSRAMVEGSAAAIQAALQRAADADADLGAQLGLATSGVETDAGDLAGGAAGPSRPAPTDPPPVSVQTYAVALEGGLGVMAGTYMLIRVERLGNGTTRVTKILSDGVGYGAGAGFDLSVMHEDRRYGASTLLGGDGMLTAGDGEVYVIPDEDYAQFREALLLDAGATKVGDVVSHLSPVGLTGGLGSMVPGVVKGVAGLVTGADYSLPEPVATVEQVGLKAEGDATWGLLAGGASADVGVTGNGSVITHDDGSRSLVYDVKADGSARAYAGFDGDSLANSSAEGAEGFKLTVDLGEDGTPEQARLDMTYGGQHASYRGEPEVDGDVDAQDNFYREQSVTVPLDDAQVRAAVRGLQRDGDVGGFLDTVGDNATITRRDYDLDSATTGLNAEGGGIIFKGGATGEFSSESATTRSAEYWDGRRWQTWE